jgi:hypothetical protein
LSFDNLHGNSAEGPFYRYIIDFFLFERFIESLSRYWEQDLFLGIGKNPYSDGV